MAAAAALVYAISLVIMRFGIVRAHKLCVSETMAMAILLLFIPQSFELTLPCHDDDVDNSNDNNTYEHIAASPLKVTGMWVV